MARILLLMVCELIVICCLCGGSRSSSHRLLRWKALLKCHGEPECHYAHEQHLHACASVLSGERRGCPSLCISSLIQLNSTRRGPALEECGCAANPACSAALRHYLLHCRRLFGGQQLDASVCDGAERTLCEHVKRSMRALCSDSGDRFAGSGSADSEEDTEQEEHPRGDKSGASPRCQTLMRALAAYLPVSH